MKKVRLFVGIVVAMLNIAASCPDPELLGDGGIRPVWTGVIGTGQSLSVGVSLGAAPPITLTQPYGAKKLVDTTGTYALSGAGDWQLAPLVEPIRKKPNVYGYEYPSNIAGETPHTGMAIQLSTLSMARDAGDFVTLHSVVGTSGQAMSSINKRGLPDGGVRPPYPASLMETRVFKNLAADAGAAYRVGAVVLTHGESDCLNPNYGTDLLDLWADYNADLKAITGQTSDIPIILSQQNSFPPTVDAGFAQSPNAQWLVGVSHPDRVVCVGPKYQYAYSDPVHLSSSGYHRLGEKYGQVFDRVVNLKQTWKPLQPKSTSLSGSTITVAFDVPVPPLAWDDAIGPSHQTNHVAWKNGRGFEAEDSTGQLTIVSATIIGDSVELLLAAPPTGTGLTVRSGYTPDGYPLADGGWAFGGAIFANSSGGYVGYLRDSDPFRGAWSETLDVAATNGSATFLVLDAGSMESWTKTDLLEGPQWTGDLRIVNQTVDGGSFKASSPWDGGTERTLLKVRHDHRNWVVQFSLPVPYAQP